MVSLICGLFKKDTNELICRTETDTDSENKLMDTKRDRWWGVGWTGGLELA